MEKGYTWQKVIHLQKQRAWFANESRYSRNSDRDRRVGEGGGAGVMVRVYSWPPSWSVLSSAS